MGDGLGIFQVVRVSYLLANRKAVIADIDPGMFVEPDLQEAVCLTRLDMVADACASLLDNESERKTAAGDAGRGNHATTRYPRDPVTGSGGLRTQLTSRRVSGRARNREAFTPAYAVKPALNQY
jgi:hypothetical protein